MDLEPVSDLVVVSPPVLPKLCTYRRREPVSSRSLRDPSPQLDYSHLREEGLQAGTPKWGIFVQKGTYISCLMSPLRH